MRRVCMKQATVTVQNKVGFHARPVSMLIDTVRKFNCTANIKKDDQSCELNNVILLLRLACKMGDTIVITCDGEDEEQCLTALVELIESKFGEE